MVDGNLPVYRFFDGEVAVPRDVWAVVDATAINLIDVHTRHERARWPRLEVRSVPAASKSDPVCLTLGNHSPARLIADKELLLALGKVPAVGGTLAERGRAFGWVGGLAALGIVLYFGLPPLARFVLVPLIPASFESSLGISVEEQMVDVMKHIRGGTGRRCADLTTSPELAAMAIPLGEAAKLDPPLQMAVYDIQLPNAFALPGNRVVLTRGLLERLRSSDQAAGVIAHEVSHLETRDPMTGLIANLGWQAIFGALFGQNMGGGVTQHLLTSANSREVENRADAGGVRLLETLGWRQTGLAEALERIDSRADETGFNYLASHPATSERKAALSAAGDGKSAPPADYTILQKLCS